MMSFRAFLNCALPLMLLKRSIGEMCRQHREASAKQRCLATHFVLANRQEPWLPCVLRLADRKRLPLVSTLEERLKMLDENGNVVLDLAPAPPERQVYLSGIGDKLGAFVVQLPEYDPERVLLVYRSVLEWVERKTSRPLDDLMAFDDLRTVEESEEGYTLTCGRIVGAFRETGLGNSAVMTREEAKRQVAALRAAEIQGCPRWRRAVDLAEMMDDVVIGMAPPIERREADDDEYMTNVIRGDQLIYAPNAIDELETMETVSW